MLLCLAVINFRFPLLLSPGSVPRRVPSYILPTPAVKNMYNVVILIVKDC